MNITLLTIPKFLLCLVFALFAASCAHIKYDNPTGKPISFTHNIGEGVNYKVIRNIENDYRRMWLIFYLLPVGNDGSDMIAATVGGTDGIVNLKVMAQYDIVDIIISNLTFGIICTRKVQIRGDLIALEKNISSPSILKAAETESTIQCSSCHAACKLGTKFCHVCGKALSMLPTQCFCPHCGKEITESSSFCTFCGRKTKLSEGGDK